MNHVHVRSWCERCCRGETVEQELFGRLWEVDRVLEFVEGLEPQLVRVEQFRGLLAFADYSQAHLPHVDLTSPILVGTVINRMRPYPVLLDGIHRVARALAGGRSSRVTFSGSPTQRASRWAEEHPLLSPLAALGSSGRLESGEKAPLPSRRSGGARGLPGWGP